VGLSRHDFTPSELSEQLAADRGGGPYLLYRDGRGVQRILPLAGSPVTVGREPGIELVLSWDAEVSRVHARLEPVGGSWTLVDDGLSRNGSFVNGERVAGRRRLAPGDRLRFGKTEALFRAPLAVPADTVPAGDGAEAIRLTGAQRQVLVALCRPVLGGDVGAVPASNKEVAAELSLSVEAVRTQLKSLFQRFDVPDLPQNRKRAELVRRAVATGVVTRRVGGPPL
jgi:DNA-binding CsgD family transcriptional regulator